MDENIWHKCRSPLFWKRTIDGGWTDIFGQTWRRRGPDGKWQYRQDEETDDEWLWRQL
jgi:hypothetical protein